MMKLLKTTAGKLTHEDIGNRVFMQEAQGTVVSKVLIGVGHKLIGVVFKNEWAPSRKELEDVLQADFYEIHLTFADGSSKKVSQNQPIEVLDDKALPVHVRNPNAPGPPTRRSS